jgi:hypothetical protein
VMTWSQPAAWSMLATSLAVIGARDRSFLSILEYGKHGITAVILFAEAVLHAEIKINSSWKKSVQFPNQHEDFLPSGIKKKKKKKKKNRTKPKTTFYFLTPGQKKKKKKKKKKNSRLWGNMDLPSIDRLDPMDFQVQLRG